VPTPEPTATSLPTLEPTATNVPTPEPTATPTENEIVTVTTSTNLIGIEGSEIILEGLQAKTLSDVGVLEAWARWDSEGEWEQISINQETGSIWGSHVYSKAGEYTARVWVHGETGDKGWMDIVLEVLLTPTPTPTATPTPLPHISGETYLRLLEKSSAVNVTELTQKDQHYYAAVNDTDNYVAGGIYFEFVDKLGLAFNSSSVFRWLWLKPRSAGLIEAKTNWLPVDWLPTELKSVNWSSVTYIHESLLGIYDASVVSLSADGIIENHSDQVQRVMVTCSLPYSGMSYPETILTSMNELFGESGMTRTRIHPFSITLEPGAVQRSAGEPGESCDLVPYR
jgi:hypothetical protein